MDKLQVVTVTLNPAIDQTLIIPGFAAGRVNRVAESRTHAGGKGVNVACCLADSGLDAVATGFLGAENAEIFEEAFARWRILDRFVRVPGRTRTGLKIVDDRSGETTDINSPGLTFKAEELTKLFKKLFLLVEPKVWFVLSGSVPTGAPDDIYADLIDVLRGPAGRVVLDTSGAPLREALASSPEVVKPNVEELGELVGRTLDTTADIRAAGESLLERGVGLVVVSMGGDGAMFLDGEQALLARPPKVAVRSTVGAGDAMVAAIVYAKILGLPLADLARLATGTGAYAVTRIGPGIENPGERGKLVEQVEIEELN